MRGHGARASVICCVADVPTNLIIRDDAIKNRNLERLPHKGQGTNSTSIAQPEEPEEANTA